MKTLMQTRVHKANFAPMAVRSLALAAVFLGSVAFANDAVDTAEWKGTAGSALDNPSNWVCKNADGDVLPGRCPTAETTVILPDGAIFNCPTGTPFTIYKLSLPATIGADCDWTGITAPFTGKLDLKGHKLKVSQLTGDAEITDTNGYVLLDYIRSNSKGEYINTGVCGKNGIQMILDAKIVSAGSSACIVGERPFYNASNPTKAGCAFWFNGSTKYPAIGYGVVDSGYTVSSLNIPLDTRCVWSNDNARLYKDGVLAINKADTQASFSSSPTAITLFALSTSAGVEATGNRVNTTQVYSLRILDNGTPVRHFVPAKRGSDGAIGLLDLVAQATGTGKEFYPNDGAGALTAGAVTGVINVGELHVVVPDGETVNNATVKLSGVLKLVKDGPGAFVASKKGQTYWGGTLIAGGSAKASLTLSANEPWSKLETSVITVGNGATLDIAGLYDYGHYQLALDGGTLANTGADLKNGVIEGWWCCGGVTLSADSSYEVSHTIRHGKNAVAYAIDMGGNTLSVSVAEGKEFAVGGPCDWRNGKVEVTGAGTFVTDFSARYTPATYDFRTADFDLGVGLRLNNTIMVRDLTVRYAGGAASSGTGAIKVFGTYLPVTDYIYNTELQDGSTIDLSSRSKALSLADRPLTFADGAKILVKIGAKSGKILDWEGAKPANFDTLAFELAPGQKGVILVKKDDGLYLLRGSRIFLR